MKRQKIVAALKRLKLDGWSLLFQEQERSTLHLTKDAEIETIIEGKRLQAEVTVYRRYGKLLGDAKFTLFTDDEAEIGARVNEALAICANAKKEAWPLPGKQSYRAVVLADPLLVTAFEERKTEKLNLRLWRRIYDAASKEHSIILNHAELHLTRLRQRVVNSAGLLARSEQTTLFIEAILTAGKGKGKTRREAEYLATATVGRLKDFDAAAFVREGAQRARDVLVAEKLAGVTGSGIALSGAALRDFWSPDLTYNPLLFHASAGTLHRGLSQRKEGERLTVNSGFTLSSDPGLSHNPFSSRFDEEGVRSRRVTVVERGRWKELVASQRYGHYLGARPTGRPGSMVLAPGKEAVASLRDGAVEIVSFSSFVPNSISGDFSAEIRLGYRHEKGRPIPVKGAMFTGNLFRMLDAMRLSKEEAEQDKYKGPALVRFDAGCHLAGF